MKKKLIIPLGMVLLLGLNIFLISTEAKATKLNFEMTEYSDPDFVQPPIEKQWIEDGILHMTGFVTYHTLDGYIDGDYIFGYTTSIFHVKLDLSTGYMKLHGTTHFEFQWGELYGAFDGLVPLAGIDDTGVWGTLLMHGSGDFEGMKMKGEFASSTIPGANDMWGELLIPN